MRLKIKYQEVEWWFWAAIGTALGFGLLGASWGYTAALLISVANLGYSVVKHGSFIDFAVQVRGVWLIFMSAAMLLGVIWFYAMLFVGMILVVFFDRCGIARVLVLMPWNKNAVIAD